MKQPHIQAALAEAKAAYIAKATEKRELLKAHAIEVAEQLLAPDQPPQVRARMVEFLAGESKNAQQINVAVNVDRGGYEYVKPGSRVIDITPAADTKPEAEGS